jgi:hypothetical protein
MILSHTRPAYICRRMVPVLGYFSLWALINQPTIAENMKPHWPDQVAICYPRY